VGQHEKYFGDSYGEKAVFAAFLCLLRCFAIERDKRYLLSIAISLQFTHMDRFSIKGSKNKIQAKCNEFTPLFIIEPARACRKIDIRLKMCYINSPYKGLEFSE
jgi:hypothetical protein